MIESQTYYRLQFFSTNPIPDKIHCIRFGSKMCSASQIAGSFSYVSWINRCIFWFLTYRCISKNGNWSSHYIRMWSAMFKYAESYVKQTFSLFFKIKDQRNSVLKYYSLLCYANLCFYIDSGQWVCRIHLSGTLLDLIEEVL